MIRLLGLVVLAILIPGAAFAQQASPQESAKALEGKLQDEINQDMQVRTLLVKTQDELAIAQKEIADLKKPPGPADKK